jgi:hypothetical protein
MLDDPSGRKRGVESKAINMECKATWYRIELASGHVWYRWFNLYVTVFYVLVNGLMDVCSILSHFVATKLSIFCSLIFYLFIYFTIFRSS